MSIQTVEIGGRKQYRVRFYEGGTKRGRQRQRTFDLYGDAVKFETAVRRATQLGQLLPELLGSEQTVREFLDEWWAKYAVAYLKPGTRESYSYPLDRWIVPYLGRLRLRDVSRETVDVYVAGLRAAGAGAPTINRCMGILQGVFNRAVEWRRLPANPFLGAKRLPHVRSVEIDAREPEGVERIRGRLGLQHATMVSVLAYEGLRPGEVFVLEWRDVLDSSGRPRPRIDVSRGLSAREVTATKSAKARAPELFAPVGRDLVELYVAQGQPDRRSLVFPADRGGIQSRHNFRARTWLPALAKVWPCTACAGRGRLSLKQRCEDCRGRGTSHYFRPYDLRHTCATLLIYAGWTVNEVAEHLGHGDPGFTARTYQHVFKDARNRRGVSIEDAIATARAVARAEAL